MLCPINTRLDPAAVAFDAVSAALKASPDVKSFLYVSKRDAYSDFKRIFNDQPELVNSITPDSLPVSFRVTPRKAELTNQLGTRFEQLDGVDSVVTPGKVLDKELRDRNRVTLALTNMFDSYQTVRNASGVTPQIYQPAFLNPYGRAVSLSFRRMF